MRTSWVLRVLIVAGLVAWAGHSAYSSRQAADWARRAAEEPPPPGILAEVPAHPAALEQAALIATNRVFPRQWGEAARFAEAWTRRRPFSSDAWAMLGQAEFMRGNRETGLAALDHSESLAPGFPAGRIEAFPIRALAGQHDHIEATARQVAALDSLAPLDIAAALISIGYPPRDVWRLAAPEGIAPSDAARLLRAIPRGSPGAQRAVYQELPESLRADAAFGSEAARIFSNPLAADVVEDLWRRHAGDSLVEIPAGASGAALLLDHVERPRPPLAPFLLGWQTPQDRIARSSFSRLESDRRYWRVGWRGSEERRPIVLYRMLMPANTGSGTIRLVVDMVESTGEQIRISADGRSGSWVSGQTLGDFPLEVRFESSSEPRIVELRLERRAIPSGGSPPEVEVVALEVLFDGE